MKEQEVKMLKKQIAKLQSEDFDLEAWKSGATIISIVAQVRRQSDRLSSIRRI